MMTRINTILHLHDNIPNLKKINQSILAAVFSVLMLSTAFLLVNYLGPQYIGINYLPAPSAGVGLLLVLILLGCYLQYHADHISFLIGREILYFYTMMTLIIFMTNAVQLTPFKPIDPWIISLESFLPFQLMELLSWTAEHPLLQKMLLLCYGSLTTQMVFLPLLIIVSGQWKKIREYYFLMLFSTLIGFSFYYFFPTTAPASNLFSPYFLDESYATGLKFYQIHHHITASTQAGGLIALPSFHVIWACYCLFLIYDWKWLFRILLPVNLGMIASCVLLGWHYPLDLIGAGFVLLITYFLLQEVNHGWIFSKVFFYFHNQLPTSLRE